MKKFLSVLILTSVLVLPFSPATAQRTTSRTRAAATTTTQRGVDTINAALMRNYLSFIASDEMEGRDTPSRGLDITAKFLAMNLAHWGLKPAGDNGTYFQKIALRRDGIDKEQTSATYNNQPLTLGEDYIPVGRNGEASGPLVFAGNGWFFKAKNVDAYKGVDAKGKIAVIFTPPDGLPRGFSQADFSGKRGEDWMDPGEYARKQGAVGLIIVPGFQFLANWQRNFQRMTEGGATSVEKFQPAGSSAPLPTIITSPRLANLLFQGEKQNGTALFDASGANTLPASFDLNAEKKISMKVVSKHNALSTQNVIGVFEGSDPVLKDEYVAVGAHYDHVGIGAPVNGDAIYNGADDDGSGTTAVLVMAEALAKAPTKPKRSIIFIWHAGEEKGLWGSRYFVENPTIPLNKIITQLNIDMIGRSKQAGDTNPRNKELSDPNEIYVIGSKMMSTDLGTLSESVNKDYLNLSFNYRYDDPNDPNRFFFRSDHFNYARKGIPIIFYFDGEHEDYHRPGDSADKIDYEKMQKVTRTVYMTLWELANRPARPVVDKQLPKELSGN